MLRLSDAMTPNDGELVHVVEAPEGTRERLDKFLAGQLAGHSRARLQGLIKAGLVQVDGDTVIKPGFGLAGGEEIEVLVPAAEDVGLVAEAIALDIVFENEDVIVVNKAAGMVVHPAVGHASGTLVNAVLGHAPDIEGVGGELRPGLVHRLDKDTSGLIVLAKNERAQRFLQAQFEAREVEKQYLALVDGQPPTQTGRVEAAIGRDPQERKKMAALPEGKGRAAVSEYRVLETFAKQSLLTVEPRTGRTHQIRVHLAFIGCPVAGDTVYGRHKPTLGLRRHFLHAAKLGIKLPGERVLRQFEAGLPEDLQSVLDGLRGIGDR